LALCPGEGAPTETPYPNVYASWSTTSPRSDRRDRAWSQRQQIVSGRQRERPRPETRAEKAVGRISEQIW